MKKIIKKKNRKSFKDVFCVYNLHNFPLKRNAC